jgi:tRNA (cytidine32/uridine32-2'-O)-methyltransferase
MLPQIRFTLVETSHPGNIGAAARAMKCMNLPSLVLVSPGNFPHPDAVSRAAGADDVLEQAQVYGSLKEAVSDCIFVAGTTARNRAIGWPVESPRAAAKKILEEASRGPVALLFGRERSGLTNAEVDSCNLLIRIPTGDDYSSLNLASAAQIMAYELFVAAGGNEAQMPSRAVAADQRILDGFYQHLERALSDLDFMKSEHPTRLMRKLVRLFNRARPTPEEVNILRGILTAAQSVRRGVGQRGPD